MRYHPTSGESSLEIARKVMERYQGNIADAQEYVTEQIAYAISVNEREFWQEVLGNLR